MIKRRIFCGVGFVLICAAAVLGTLLLGGERWDIAALIAAVLCCVPFFLSFESRRPAARELVLIAVMVAFSSAGRLIFVALPFFKPVAAVVIIAAMYFGSGAGFMVGAMTALISNIFFGQGAWTPFQMLGWGLIGFAAGLLNSRKWLEKPLPLCIYGVLAGLLFSLVMDIWTVLSAEGVFSFSRWIASAVAALPVTAAYCVSNVVFLLLLFKPLGRKLCRLREKYGVFVE